MRRLERDSNFCDCMRVIDVLHNRVAGKEKKSNDESREEEKEHP